MRKQKQLREQKRKPIGQPDDLKNLRILNVVALLILSAYNVMHYIINKNLSLESFLNVSSFLVYGFIIYKIRHKIALYIVYIIVGSITLLSAERAIEYSGVVFFIFACGLFNTPKYLLISFTMAFMGLSVRLTLLSNSIPITIQMLLLFCFISATAYLIFFKKPKRRVDLWKEISEKEKAILKLYMNGKDYSQISRILNIKDKKESIRTSITRARNDSGCDNDIQFGIWLSDKG